MLQVSGDANERIGAASAAAATQVLIGALLIWGLNVSTTAPSPPALRAPAPALTIIEPIRVRPTPPPVEPSIETARFNPGREGAGAAPNLRSEATEIVVPPAIILRPPPLAAAPIAGTGSDPMTGDAPIRGPGTGAGGFGDGSGTGANGDGGGGGFGPERPPRLLRGRIGDGDYPAAAGAAGHGGTVSIRFTVSLDGRAVNCRVTGSSGSDALDSATCRLVERRYRFDPSRDGRGRPILSEIVESHSWIVEDEPRRRSR